MKTPINSKKVLVSIIFFLVVLINNEIVIMAQWTDKSYKNTPVCLNDVSTGTSVSISDEKGGVFIAWADANRDVYIQHVDSKGFTTWAANGILVCGLTKWQINLSLAPDGNDGVFLCWEDERNESLDIFCQHIDKDGGLLWTADGLLLAGGINHQTTPQIISDFNNGFILVWKHFKDDFTVTKNIRIQRFNADGSGLWGSSAILVTDTIDIVSNISISADSLGGAFISWTDTRKGKKIYAQHINSLGSQLWGEGVVVASNPINIVESSSCTADGEGGMFVAWQDGRDYPTNISTTDIYVQHILSSGEIAYEKNGKLLCNAKGNQSLPQIVTDAQGGAIIAWLDYRNYESIYVQRIKKNSELAFEENGIFLRFKCGNFSILPDNAGGAFLAAMDGGTSLYTLFARHLKHDGTFEWSNDFQGTTFCGNMTIKSKPGCSTDTKNGLIVVWDDTRNAGKANIFVQRVLSNGDLANTANLSVSSNTLSIEASANSTITFDITSNISWTIVKNQDWLSLSSASGLNNATITLTAEANPTAATRSATVTVSGADAADQIITVIQDAGATGILNTDGSKIKFYPNPANNILFIDGLTTVSNISIFDLNGKMVFNKKIAEGSLDIGSLNIGFYTIKLEVGNVIHTLKFEKK